MKKNIILIITFIIITSIYNIYYLKAENVKYALTYKGKTPYELSAHNREISKYRKVGKLLNLNNDNIISINNNSFIIYSFDKNNWRLETNIDINDTSLITDFAGRPKNFGHSTFEENNWTVGDVDNDGIDDILIWGENKYIVYNCRNGKITKKTYRFPYYISQSIIGDIDNDNKNEIISFCVYERNSEEAPMITYNLCVSKIIDNSVLLIWEDKNKFGFENSGVVPPDTLDNISNIGYNHNVLIIQHSIFDMSNPSKFSIFTWTNSELKESTVSLYSESFLTVQKDTSTETFVPYVQWAFEPINKNSNTFLGYMIFSPSPSNKYSREFNTVVFSINKNKVKINSIIYKDIEQDYFSNQFYWMDIDGRGKGILQLTNNYSGDSTYYFYR